LTLAGSLVVLGVLSGRFAAGDAGPAAYHAEIEPPSPEEEALWAAVGLNEAWYVLNGYTEAPPPSAPSPFLQEKPLQPAEAGDLVDLDSPQLVLDPRAVAFRVYVDDPKLLERQVIIRDGNAGGETLAWVAELAPGGTFTPTLSPLSGGPGKALELTVDGKFYVDADTGITYTRRITITATPSDTLDNPQILTTTLFVDPTPLGPYAYNMPYVPKEPTQTPTPTPTPTPMPTPTATPLPGFDEVRAIWVTRFDWTPVTDADDGRRRIDEIVSNIAGAGFNTILFQIRGNGDAYYRPGLEPWSDRLNAGRVLGQDPGWDPLGYMLDKAHERGIQLHAYVNVFPTWLGAEAPLRYTTPEHPFWSWSKEPPEGYGWAGWRQWAYPDDPMNLNVSYLWASPGVDGVRDHVVEVVKDIVRRYAVDGVHLDLVRYANSNYSYDPISNASSGSSVKTAERDQWQRDRVTGLVSRVYSSIRDVRPGTRLSAAVWFCHDEHVNDACGHRLSDGFDGFYQDSVGWLAQGVIDAIAPMLYGADAFQENWRWEDVMLQFQGRNAGRHVYPGISGNLSSFSDIAYRIQAARDAGAAGHAIFSYGAVNTHGYWDDFAAGPYAQPAALSPLPWH
jgi:uncharacterized lipoprotein YddW (UPF0748 family)